MYTCTTVTYLHEGSRVMRVRSTLQEQCFSIKYAIFRANFCKIPKNLENKNNVLIPPPPLDIPKYVTIMFTALITNYIFAM